MLQISDSVGSAQNGSMTAVLGSGTTSMSLAWMGCQPRIEEPSNPSPSSNTASSISLGGTVKCCQIPRKSLNLKSIATAFWSFMNLITSFGVMPSLLLAVIVVVGLFREFFGGTFLRVALPFVGLALDGIRPSFTGADAHYILDGHHEDLAVANAARLCRLGDCLHDLGDHFVLHDDLQLHFRQEV